MGSSSGPEAVACRLLRKDRAGGRAAVAVRPLGLRGMVTFSTGVVALVLDRRAAGQYNAPKGGFWAWAGFSSAASALSTFVGREELLRVEG